MSSRQLVILGAIGKPPGICENNNRENQEGNKHSLQKDSHAEVGISVNWSPHSVITETGLVHHI